MTTAVRNPRRDRGSAGVEAALAVTALLGVALFTVGALRVTTTSGDVGSAARAGARAEASARADQRGSLAEPVVDAALAERGVACSDLDVDVDPSPEVVTVTVTCTVVLGDVGPGGFSSNRTVSASATEAIDAVRGGDG